LTALGKQRAEGLANRDGLSSGLTIASAPSTVPKPQP
jgi:hypothetical protein